MLKAIVVDDENLSAQYICRLLENEKVQVLYQSTNPCEAFEKIHRLEPDVVFLDIEMPEISGLDLAERLTSGGYAGEIVFVTAYSQYAIEAFEVNALAYLLKPIRKEELRKAIDRVEKRRAATLAYDKYNNEHRKIRISLLGNASLYIGEDNTPIRWLTSKSAELLAFMLLQKDYKEISKWKLIEAIWPDKDKDKGDINLRSTISRLNKTLRENFIKISIISTGNGYKLDVKEEDIEVDAFKLEAMILSSAKISHENVNYYESIILEYKAMLLEGFSEEWCNSLRNIYHMYFINGAKKLVNYYENNSVEPARILNIIELMIKYEPYDESLREIALKLHYNIGGRKSAQKYYRDYCKLIKKDLGIEPPVLGGGLL